MRTFLLFTFLLFCLLPGQTFAGHKDKEKTAQKTDCASIQPTAIGGEPVKCTNFEVNAYLLRQMSVVDRAEWNRKVLNALAIHNTNLEVLSCLNDFTKVDLIACRKHAREVMRKAVELCKEMGCEVDEE